MLLHLVSTFLGRADNWLVDTAEEKPVHNGLTEFGKVSEGSVEGFEGGRGPYGQREKRLCHWPDAERLNKSSH